MRFIQRNFRILAILGVSVFILFVAVQMLPREAAMSGFASSIRLFRAGLPRRGDRPRAPSPMLD
jgi:hypothetical protein